MTFGEPGKEGARVHDIQDAEAILNVFRSHGHTEVFNTIIDRFGTAFQYFIWKIDTARVYSGGTSEEYLGKIDLASKGLKIETKLYPMKVSL